MHPNLPALIVRLGDDFNWWLDRTADESPAPPAEHGLLDPRQVSHLAQALDEYRRHGLDPRQFTAAFHAFALDADIAEGRLRLEPTDVGLLSDAELFALPAIDADGDGPYFDFLDALGAARIRRLNTTGHYVRECTMDEMQDELDTLDQDRYFNAEEIHVFDQINEILEWKPAAWDES
jgi:hypothetical protein